MLNIVLKAYFLQKEGANLELIQLPPRIIRPLLSNCEQALDMPFAELNRRNKGAGVPLLLIGPFLKILVVELDKADVMRAYIEEHKFFAKDVLRELVRHVKDLLKKHKHMTRQLQIESGLSELVGHGASGALAVGVLLGIVEAVLLQVQVEQPVRVHDQVHQLVQNAAQHVLPVLLRLLVLFVGALLRFVVGLGLLPGESVVRVDRLHEHRRSIVFLGRFLRAGFESTREIHLVHLFEELSDPFEILENGDGLYKMIIACVLGTDEQRLVIHENHTLEVAFLVKVDYIDASELLADLQLLWVQVHLEQRRNQIRQEE